MKDKQNKHEVFREPYAKKIKKNPLAELNSSKEDESDDTLPLDMEADYVLKSSKKRKKRDKKKELQLITKIESIALEEPSSSSTTEFEHPTEHEEDGEPPIRDGTPVRKKKKSKKVLDKLCSIQETFHEEAKSSSEDQVKRKKKSKRKLNDDDELMEDSKEHRHKEKSAKKAKKVKLDDSYEASKSGSDGDTADRINAEQELLHSAKKLTKSEKKQEKLRLRNAYKALSVTNL